MQSNDEPVVLTEDQNTGDRFLVYATDGGLRLDVRYEGDTLWMSQTQIADLFGVSRQAVNGHLINIYDEEELVRESTCKEILQVQTEGGREVRRRTFFHNLDAIISVGYRVSSTQATTFRKWSTAILVQFAKRGFVVDATRLKQPDNADRIAELREIIRDIRADEANVYRELRAICAMCQDYEGSTRAAREFYQRMQAKLVYAVTSRTPSEIVVERADANATNMGLQTWSGEHPRKQDAAVSKNYLTPSEIRELNRLTVILLDIFEDQLDIGRLVIMEDAKRLLDQHLTNLNRAVLRGGRSVKAADARMRAERVYAAFDEERKSTRHRLADENIDRLAKEARALPKSRKK